MKVHNCLKLGTTFRSTYLNNDTRFLGREGIETGVKVG